MKKNIMTQEEVRHYFEYDKQTGKLINKTQRGRALIGKHSSNKSSKYYRIYVNKTYYSEHLLIWIYHYGTDFDEIDHINGNPVDNRIGNLRNITHQQNQQNRKLGNNKSYTKIPGVFYEKSRNYYRVRLFIDGIYKSFGTYHDVKDAEQMCIDMRRKYYLGNTL